MDLYGEVLLPFLLKFIKNKQGITTQWIKASCEVELNTYFCLTLVLLFYQSGHIVQVALCL